MRGHKSIFNWSGGKDSSLALYKILLEKKIEVRYLLTSVNQHFNRVSMHGVRVELLEAQAKSIGIPLQKLLLPEAPSMEEYNRTLANVMQSFKDEGINYSVFGDIFLEDLKKYREEQLQKVKIEAVFPLWKQPTEKLMNEFIDLGFKAVIVCINEKYLDKSFSGRLIDKDFIKDLPKNVDVCGENGEYHSFVFDGPIFNTPIDFKIGEIVFRKYKPVSSNANDNCGVNSTAQNFDTGFYYCDLEENLITA